MCGLRRRVRLDCRGAACGGRGGQTGARPRSRVPRLLPRLRRKTRAAHGTPDETALVCFTIGGRPSSGLAASPRGIDEADTGDRGGSSVCDWLIERRAGATACTGRPLHSETTESGLFFLGTTRHRPPERRRCSESAVKDIHLRRGVGATPHHVRGGLSWLAEERFADDVLGFFSSYGRLARLHSVDARPRPARSCSFRRSSLIYVRLLS